MKSYQIVDDSGVDYNFLNGFGYKSKSWKGQVVKGADKPINGLLTVEKPFGIVGTYTASPEVFKEV